MPPYRIIALLNWGMGAEVLRALAGAEGWEVLLAVGRFQPGHPDPWFNAVGETARELGIPFLPEDGLAMADLAELVRTSGADLLFTHAFMRMLPAEVYAAPALGGVNLHASLLPRHRGPSPTYWALRDGDASTGLTLHRLCEEMDAGAIIHQVEVPLLAGDRPSRVIERLKEVAPEAVREGLRRLRAPGFIPLLQDETRATYEPRPRQG